MAAKNNMTALAGKKLLVAPLDWGLGHATRCVPIIRDLLNNNCEVWLASEGAQEKLLREEFPLLPFLPLKGYRIRFSKNGLIARLLFQVPSILRSIRQENNWLKEQINKHRFDAVVSDNRYGLFHEDVFSVFITHQLRVKSPLGKLSEDILQRWNYKLINEFDECWVPDKESEDNLAGRLSHPGRLPSIPVKYIGALSRFSKLNIEEIKNHLLIILSGPEPQRTIFENRIIDEIVNYPGTATIVRGLPGEKNILPSTNTIHFYNHLMSDELNKEMMKAEFIISRSGYSTIMDIAALGKKSILVPTPGQTEQVYLADHLMKKRMAYCVRQNDFTLSKVLENARSFNFTIRP